MEPALGELLTFLQKQTLAKEGIAYTETASIKDCSLITSFNWLEGKSAIVIPGNFILDLINQNTDIMTRTATEMDTFE